MVKRQLAGPEPVFFHTNDSSEAKSKEPNSYFDLFNWEQPEDHDDLYDHRVIYGPHFPISLEGKSTAAAQRLAREYAYELKFHAIKVRTAMLLEQGLGYTWHETGPEIRQLMTEQSLIGVTPDGVLEVLTSTQKPAFPTYSESQHLDEDATGIVQILENQLQAIHDMCRDSHLAKDQLIKCWKCLYAPKICLFCHHQHPSTEEYFFAVLTENILPWIS